MGSDELILFQESHYDELVDKFIEENLSKWEDFVAEEYTDWYAGSIDHAKDTGDKL